MFGATATLRRASLADPEDCGRAVEECCFCGDEIYRGDNVYEVEAGLIHPRCLDEYADEMGVTIEELDAYPVVAGEDEPPWAR